MRRRSAIGSTLVCLQARIEQIAVNTILRSKPFLPAALRAVLLEDALLLVVLVGEPASALLLAVRAADVLVHLEAGHHHEHVRLVTWQQKNDV